MPLLNWKLMGRLTLYNLLIMLETHLLKTVFIPIKLTRMIHKNSTAG